MSRIELKPIQRKTVKLTIIGLSPLVTNKMSERAKEAMRNKSVGGVKTKQRYVRNPEQECEEATYRNLKGEIGIPAQAIKGSIIGAAHKDLGIEKTLVRKALFIKSDDSKILPINCTEANLREDCLNVGTGKDLRYRPEFRGWSCDLEIEYDAELLELNALMNLINRAGFGVGVGEMRPELGGEYGRFEIDTATQVRS